MTKPCSLRGFLAPLLILAEPTWAFLIRKGQKTSVRDNVRDSTLRRRQRFCTFPADQQEGIQSVTSVDGSDDISQGMTGGGGVGFYIHIPFCRRRCRYCNFAIVPVGGPERHRTATTTTTTTNANDAPNPSPLGTGFEALNQNYTLTVLREIQTLFRQEKRHLQLQPGWSKIALQSIYFGGGTPSLAPVSSIRAILDEILNNPNSPFEAAPNIEVTMEMDPGTFDLPKLQELRDLGVNRISLGIQSFAGAVLESLGRQHTVEDIWQSLRLLTKVYGRDELNYSIDLISGLPGVSIASWAETIYTALNKLDPFPNHMSIYDLQIESGTVFAKWYDADKDDDDDDTTSTARSTWHSTKGSSNSGLPPPLPSDEDAAFQYQFTAGYLRAKGFEHYEVSSYARIQQQHGRISPWRSRHNQVYWGYDTQWYSVGLGATSFIRGQIVARPRAMFDYANWVRQEEEQEERQSVSDLKSALIRGQEDLSKTLTPSSDLDRLTDVVLKRLRTSEGLDLNWVRSKFGQDYVSAIVRGAQLGLDLKLAVMESGILRLVDSKGFLYSNSVISSIFVELEMVRL